MGRDDDVQQRHAVRRHRDGAGVGGGAHGTHEPPQSIAVSSPSLTPFLQNEPQHASVPTGRPKAAPFEVPHTRPG